MRDGQRNIKFNIKRVETCFSFCCVFVDLENKNKKTKTKTKTKTKQNKTKNAANHLPWYTITREVPALVWVRSSQQSPEKDLVSYGQWSTLWGRDCSQVDPGRLRDATHGQASASHFSSFVCLLFVKRSCSFKPEPDPDITYAAPERVLAVLELEHVSDVTAVTWTCFQCIAKTTDGKIVSDVTRHACL